MEKGSYGHVWTRDGMMVVTEWYAPKNLATVLVCGHMVLIAMGRSSDLGSQGVVCHSVSPPPFTLLLHH